ncbi:MAG: DUF4231 domain-containing protein [Prevotella sp.]|jgi:uncharacterized membrane protein|nr:DUF4231 domain-containing protein [Prevotella sp.]
MVNKWETVELQVENAYARVTWSHKIQEKQADIYQREYKFLRITDIAASAMTAAGIMTVLFVDQTWIKLVSAIVSFASVFISLYLNYFDLSKLTKLHKETANQLLAIRNKIEILLTEIRIENRSSQEIIDDYKKTIETLNDIYKNAPQTTDKAEKLARNALNEKRDNSFSEDELNTILPGGLKRSKNELDG